MPPEIQRNLRGEYSETSPLRSVLEASFRSIYFFDGWFFMNGNPLLIEEVQQVVRLCDEALQNPITPDDQRREVYRRLKERKPEDAKIYAPDIWAEDQRVYSGPCTSKVKLTNQQKGFVYLCRDGRNGLVKIGFSTEPKFREKTLQSEVPEVQMLFNFPGTMALEKELHRKYQAHRVRGEWFSLTENEVETLRQQFIQST